MHNTIVAMLNMLNFVLQILFFINLNTKQASVFLLCKHAAALAFCVKNKPGAKEFGLALLPSKDICANKFYLLFLG